MCLTITEKYIKQDIVIIQEGKMVVSYKNLTIVFLIALIISLLAVNVTATSFTTNLKQEKARIMPGENAVYTLTINNADSYSQTYNFGLSAADAPNWVVSPSSLKVDALSSNSVDLKVIPKSSTPIDSYILALKVRDKDQAEKTVGVPLILSLDAFVNGYKPNVALNPSFPGEQDPREKLKMTLVLRNRNPSEIEVVKITIESELFSKEYELKLESLQEVTKEFVFTLDPLQTPGDYPIITRVVVDDDEIERSEKILSIKKYSTVTPESKSETNWFYTTEIITLQNNGNYERIKELGVEAPWTKRIFMGSNPEGLYQNEDGKSLLKWTVNLKPTESKTIIVTTNYRPLVIIIVIILIAIILYYILRSPLVMLKEAAVVKQDNEGISEAKVRIFVKNRSRKPVHAVTITDRLPRITHLSESAHALGGLKPTKVTSTEKRGTILYWDIDTLEAYEERIITYRMTSKLKVVGNLTLPKVTAKFDTGNGKERKIQSLVPVFTKK